MDHKDLENLSTEQLLEELSRRRHGDKQTLHEIEEDIESVARSDKQRAFASWLRRLESQETEEPKPCPTCGRLVAVNAKKRPRVIMTLHGRFTYRRNHHHCRHCERGFHPMDDAVGCPEQGEATPSLQKRMLDFGLNDSYEQAVSRFVMHYGFSVSTCLMRSVIERLPMPEYVKHEAAEPDGRLTVQVDGSMLSTTEGWKEAKLGVVLSDKHYTPKNKDKRGHVTQASYIGTMGGVKDFEQHLKGALPPRVPVKDRGKKPVADIVWIGDGAAWIWKLMARIAPTAIGILDIYHALEHAADCAKVVLDGDDEGQHTWMQSIKQQLYEGNVKTVIKQLKECLLMSDNKDKQDALKSLITYYAHNKKRMNYDIHLKAGRMIGSGIIESAHKHVLQTRMKKAGQRWSPAGAEKMVRLRSLYRTHGPTDFYDSLIKQAA